MSTVHRRLRQSAVSLAACCMLALVGCGGSDGNTTTPPPSSGGGNNGGTTGGSTNTVGSASLRWAAPTTNSDGTPLTDLAGYHIYYGTNADLLSNEIPVEATQTSLVINNLAVGTTYYFAITALNSTGSESSLSDTVSKTIS
jgi:hypothetical protein